MGVIKIRQSRPTLTTEELEARLDLLEKRLKRLEGEPDPPTEPPPVRTVTMNHVLDNCLDCPYSEVVADPGEDSFDASDEAVLCKNTAPEQDRYMTPPRTCWPSGRMIVGAERWHIRKHCSIPEWCPLLSDKK